MLICYGRLAPQQEQATMDEFFTEDKSNNIVQEAKDFAAYLTQNIFNVISIPFSLDNTPKISRKTFYTYVAALRSKIYNDCSAAVVMGEMRGIERVMKYLEESDTFKNDPQRDLFYGDLLMMLSDLNGKIKKEFHFDCNVDKDFVIERTNRYVNTESTNTQQVI